MADRAGKAPKSPTEPTNEISVSIPIKGTIGGNCMNTIMVLLNVAIKKSFLERSKDNLSFQIKFFPPDQIIFNEYVNVNR